MTGAFDRFWRSVAAGFCGNLVHSALMALKSWAGWLPGFQPYKDLQATLAQMLGTSVPAIGPWLLSYLNGAVVLGFLYSQVHRHLPGRNGAVKGAMFGIVGWLLMDLLFLPATGKGVFGLKAGLGLAPAGFTLLMILAYSVTLGIAYAAFSPGKR